MRMTRTEALKRFPDRPTPPPTKLSGKWVAWNANRSQIVAQGERFAEVHASAVAAGCKEPLMQRVLGTSFVG